MKYWIVGILSLCIWTFIVFRVTVELVEPCATMVAVNSGLGK